MSPPAREYAARCSLLRGLGRRRRGILVDGVHLAEYAIHAGEVEGLRCGLILECLDFGLDLLAESDELIGSLTGIPAR